MGDLGLITGLGIPEFNPRVRKIPGEGNGYSLQYSGLENSMACVVHGVTRSRIRLSHIFKDPNPNAVAF